MVHPDCAGGRRDRGAIGLPAKGAITLAPIQAVRLQTPSVDSQSSQLAVTWGCSVVCLAATDHDPVTAILDHRGAYIHGGKTDFGRELCAVRMIAANRQYRHL
jgi:hypothetical protein